MRNVHCIVLVPTAEVDAMHSCTRTGIICAGSDVPGCPALMRKNLEIVPCMRYVVLCFGAGALGSYGTLSKDFEKRWVGE